MEYSPQIKIVTVATSESGYMKWLKQSCIRNDTELVVLGMGMKWEGYVTKFQLVNEFLKNEDDRNIICFVDAYDVIMMKNVQKLKEDFIRYTEENNCKIICSLAPLGKTGINDLDNLIEEITRKNFSASKDSLRTNSGLYIGYVKELKILLNETTRMRELTGEVDDEKLLNIFYGNNKDIISIDVENKFFLNVSFLDFIDKEDYGYDSYFIHRIGNGPLINLLEKNGYTLNCREKVNLAFDAFNSMSLKIPYHLEKIVDSCNK